MMKPSSDPLILIRSYVDYATIEGESKLNGDYKLGNRMVKKLNKIFNVLQSDDNLAHEVVAGIFASNSTRAKGLAAVDALRLNIYIDEAVDILENIAKQDDIIGFGSQMALRIWRGEFPGKTL